MLSGTNTGTYAKSWDGRIDQQRQDAFCVLGIKGQPGNVRAFNIVMSICGGVNYFGPENAARFALDGSIFVTQYPKLYEDLGAE
jgi:hypothetical protein